MMRWDCYCFKVVQSGELLAEFAASHVQVKRLDAREDVSSWTVIWNPFREKRPKQLRLNGTSRWRFDFTDVATRYLIEDDGEAGTDDDVGGANIVAAKDDAEVSMFTADGGDRLDEDEALSLLRNRLTFPLQALADADDTKCW